MQIDLESFRTNEDWLRFIVQIGQEAQRLLKSADSGPAHLDWDQLAPRFYTTVYPPTSPASRPDHDRWLDGLLNWADLAKIAFPERFTLAHASLLAADLRARGTDPARRFRFYRRVWLTVGLDPLVWNAREALARKDDAEHYRRLSTAEVRRLVQSARKKSADLADMILIGYWTGLRLSDVAELERSEVQLSRRVLRIVPNKVRDRKPRPLTIPLVGDAESIVRKRMRTTGGERLFTLAQQPHLSRQIGQIFKTSRILKIGTGRASFHSLRATFISLMDEAGIQPYITDAITGHSGGNMHARYSQPSTSVLRRAIAKAIPKVSDAVSVASISQ